MEKNTPLWVQFQKSIKNTLTHICMATQFPGLVQALQ